MKDERKPFWRDEFSIDKFNRNVNRVLPILQNVVDSFAAIKVEVLTIQEIINLLDNSRRLIPEQLEDLVYCKLYPTPPAGFTPERFRQFAAMPDLAEVMQAFEPLAGYQDSPHYKDRVYWSVYSLNSGQVVIEETALNEIINQFQEFAETPQEKQRLAIVTELCRNLDKLAEMGAIGNISAIVQFNDSTKQYEPARDFIKSGNTNGGFLMGRMPQPDMKSQPAHRVNESAPDDGEAATAANIAALRNQK